MPPDYESASFWEARFERETHFEWLGDGRSTILPVVRDYLEEQKRRVEKHPEEAGNGGVLHIGAGTSTLGEALVDLYHAHFGIGEQEKEKPVVVNTDFAQQAVTRGSQHTKDGAEVWERVDLLQWADCADLLGRRGRFGVVVDKSTSDAVSCGADVLFHVGEDKGVHPALRGEGEEGGEVRMGPLEVLAVHLASLVQLGGVWVVLSYSKDRFAWLSTAKIDITRFWTLSSVKSVEAPWSGEKQGNVHLPRIEHWLYVLRRTDVDIDVDVAAQN
ncbi:hypothetical protein BDW22DRAFT_1320428 [Trametopsis cervina]|nr:hypothetical protein BDW22DRAFT_1320428 [Trametopsis cervina]